MRVPTLLAAVGVVGALTLPAAADPFAPVGLWRGEGSGDFILVWRDWFSSTGGSGPFAGPCNWSPEAREGTLSLTSGEESLDVTVRSLSLDTILVNEAERYDLSG